MKDIIFEALIAEASIKVGKLVRRGKSLDESVSSVAQEMELTEEEAAELTKRTKKAPPKTKAKETPKSEIKEETIEEEESLLPESLYFGSLEEVEQATGVLMAKGIAWGSKGSDGSGHYLQFESQVQLEKAHGALKRRWDFVDKKPRKVAMVEFDNLADFERVLEFMNKQGLMIEFDQNDDISLDEDLSVIDEMINKQTLEAEQASKDGFIPPEIMTRPVRSYSARVKEDRLDLSEINVYDDRKIRRARIRRRWR